MAACRKRVPLYIQVSAPGQRILLILIIMQFDTTATAVIMTRNSTKVILLNMARYSSVGFLTLFRPSMKPFSAETN